MAPSRTKPLREVIAMAIRADGSDLCDGPWDQIGAERKIGWLGDADRVIEALGRELADHGPERLLAALKAASREA